MLNYQRVTFKNNHIYIATSPSISYFPIESRAESDRSMTGPYMMVNIWSWQLYQNILDISYIYIHIIQYIYIQYIYIQYTGYIHIYSIYTAYIYIYMFISSGWWWSAWWSIAPSPEVLIYFWDERDGPELCGWWLGPKARAKGQAPSHGDQVIGPRPM